MFVNIVDFPALRDGKDKEFLEWFEWSNKVYAKFDGFISRRLLEPTKGGNYAAIVEHESEKTFMAMHLSPERQKAWERVEPLLAGKPTPRFYDALAGKGR